MADGALGEFPLGGFSGSLSVADPLSGLLSDPEAKREFLLRAEPKDALGFGNPVDLSGGGYVSRSTDSPFKHFQPAIRRPGDFTVSLPIPALHGTTAGGVGAVTVNNVDGLLDVFMGLDWLGIDMQVLLGPKDGALSDFTPILRGPGSGVSRGLDDALILFRDAKFKLQRALQPNKYGGFGAEVRGDGIAGYMTGSVTPPAGSMTLEARVRTRASITAGRPIISWRNGAGAGFREIGVAENGGTDKFSAVVRNDAGTIFVLDGSTAFTFGTQHMVSMTLDAPNLLLKVYVDGVQDGSMAVTGTFNTVLSTMAALRYADLATFLNAEVDDIRIWNVVRTSDQVLSTYNRALNGTETGLTYYNPVNEGSGTTAAPTVGSGTLTLTGGAAIKWIGSLEGDASLIGKPKPLAFGVRRQVEPVWVDTQNGVRQFHDGPLNAITALRDKGDPITFGSDVSDIYASAPSAGTYNTCLAKGLVRMGSAPVGIITGDIQGDNAGTGGYQSTVTGIAKKILLQYCGWSTGDIDDASFAALLALDSSVNGFYWDSEINRDAALQEVFVSIWSWWGPNRVGAITCGRTPAPETKTATVFLTKTDVVEPTKGGRFRDDPMGVRVGEVRVLHRPYHKVMSDTDIAGAVSLATRKDYGNPYRVARAVDPLKSVDADELEITTNIDDTTAAQALAQAILDIMKTDRRLLKITLEAGILSYFIGTIVNFVLARYALGPGKNYMIVKLSEFYGDSANPDRVEVDLFG